MQFLYCVDSEMMRLRLILDELEGFKEAPIPNMSLKIRTVVELTPEFWIFVGRVSKSKIINQLIHMLSVSRHGGLSKEEAAAEGNVFILGFIRGIIRLFGPGVEDLKLMQAWIKIEIEDEEL